MSYVPTAAQQAATLATPVTGFSSAPGSVTSADTVLSAIDKLDGNVNQTKTSQGLSIMLATSNYQQ
jgi:hypothetical protein